MTQLILYVATLIFSFSFVTATRFRKRIQFLFICTEFTIVSLWSGSYLAVVGSHYFLCAPHYAIVIYTCTDDHTLFLSIFAFLSPGSLLPNHSDAPLWKGLQNVQQDFPIPRVRYHRSSWRQWVVDLIFLNMWPKWVLTDLLIRYLRPV